jgi:hypothetical protein
LGSFERVRLWIGGTAAMASSFGEAMSKITTTPVSRR